MNDKDNILELRATMANQQDLIDALEHTEKRLERENEELKAQVEQYQKMFNESPDLTFDTCLTMFPEEISEVKALAGKDGFMQCIKFVRLGIEPNSGHANQYANQLRQQIKGGE